MKIPEYVALPYAIIFVSCIMDLDTCVDSHENLKVSWPSASSSANILPRYFSSGGAQETIYGTV